MLFCRNIQYRKSLQTLINISIFTYTINYIKIALMHLFHYTKQPFGLFSVTVAIRKYERTIYMNIIIKNINTLIGSGDNKELKTTNICITDDTITALGDIPDNFTADETIDGNNLCAIPGLINAHTHSYMSFMRNVADDLPFMEWLFGRVDPIEQRMQDTDAYWGAKLAILEMMKSGTTCFNDMQMHIGQTSRAVLESGMRAVISRGLVGQGDDETGRTKLAEAFQEINEFKGNDRLTFMLGPHAPYTCDEAYLNIVAGKAQEHNLGIHMHLSESLTEIENCQKDYGCTPIELAFRSGLFKSRFIAAHCVQATDADIRLLADNNVSVVTNPASNMKLGNGFAPIPKMMAAGINVCIGTDGAASNNSLNLIHEMSLLALVHKGLNHDPECVSANKIFDFATINGATALGLQDKIGSIEVGKKADIVLINTHNPQLWPTNNLISALSYSANGSEVDTVIINGKITMKHREVLTLDEEKIYYETGRIMERLKG